MVKHVQHAFRCNNKTNRLACLLLSGCLVVPAVTSAGGWLTAPYERYVSATSQTTVSGVVRDAAGNPMAGVTVALKQAGITTTTNDAGRYQLTVGAGGDVVVFSFVGFFTEEITIDSTAAATQTTRDVVLEEDAQALDEVVVVGYGTQSRATLTGSVSEVKGAELIKSPQPNLSNSLAGRFSGLVATNRGGEPGYDGSQLRIRGVSTTGNTDVLVVVDGVPGQVGGLERLDPNDIESVTVLKDAAAAVYGSRAANGVILVTTRKGQSGKPTVSYSFNQGFSSPTRL